MIWFDLDNTPHVPLFRPILRELERRGEPFFVTSRRHAQTEDLLQLWNIRHRTVGGHGGKHLSGKLLNLGQRALQLVGAVRGQHVNFAVSHGSRAHMVASRLLRLPYLVMDDYEYSEQHLAALLTTYMLFPAFIPQERLAAIGIPLKKVIRYQGYKEEVYLNDFVPDMAFRSLIGVDRETILVTMRPPSISANYHEGKSEELFTTAIRAIAAQDRTLCLIVNRTEEERRLVPEELLRAGKARFLALPVDGLQLLWNSDAVISGGGTMNREAALLGIPTFSVFTGRRPAADEQLQRDGHLKFIETLEQSKCLRVPKRTIGTDFHPSNTGLASWIADLILDLARRRS